MKDKIITLDTRYRDAASIHARINAKGNRLVFYPLTASITPITIAKIQRQLICQYAPQMLYLRSQFMSNSH